MKYYKLVLLLGLLMESPGQAQAINIVGSKKPIVIKPKAHIKKPAAAPAPEPEEGIAAKAIASNGLDVPDNLIQK